MHRSNASATAFSRLSDIKELAELEFVNAQVHPDQYDVRFRQRFVEHLSDYNNLDELLCKYCVDYRSLRSAVASDDRGLKQLRIYVDRLHHYLTETGQLEQSTSDTYMALFETMFETM